MSGVCLFCQLPFVRSTHSPIAHSRPFLRLSCLRIVDKSIEIEGLLACRIILVIERKLLCSRLHFLDSIREKELVTLKISA